MVKYIKQEMSEQLGTGKAFYRLQRFSNFKMEDFIDFMVRNEGLKESEVRAVIAGLTQQVAQILSQGHTVTIDGFGTFSVSLGVVEGKQVTGLDSDEPKLNSQSIGVRNVLFKADKGFVQTVDSMTDLERGEECPIDRPQSTREERLAQLHSWLESHDSATVLDYRQLTKLNRSSATRELRAFAQDPASGITTKGLGSHTVYVKK